MRLAVIVLAAGEGKRMASSRPKVLHRLCGRPMIDYVLDAAVALGPAEIVAVVEKEGPVAEHLRALGAQVAFQPVRQGTGDAARIGLGAATEPTHVLVLNGDVPLLRPETLAQILERGAGADLCLLGAELADPAGYGRLFDGPDGVRIVEEADATDAERAHTLVNVGVYFGTAAFFASELPQLSRGNRQGEYYLTDLAHRAGPGRCRVVTAADEQEVLGINTREQLAGVEALLRRRKARELMLSGVTLRDPQRTYVDWDVRVGRDTEIYPGAVLEGSTVIGAHCTIYPGARIVDSRVEDGAVVLDSSVLESCLVGPEAQVGPMAHLRPGSVLGARCRVGNFVETKKAVLGDGSKAAHLSYLGDAEIGKDVNIGCGTITCNYDGVGKHKTIIEDGVFVGSDSQFVAPVRIGRGAIIASGTTVTGDVPPEALLLARAPAVVKEGYAPRYWATRREKSGKKKE
jgi:bifunctional UDP-N-acetylglucosamine pyrophosphorylase / glucosamine-1-phosphate N-acetyltransferase